MQETKSESKRPVGTNFYVVVKEGVTLRNQKYTDIRSPSVLIQVGNGRDKNQRTEIATNVQDPVWDEHLQFNNITGSEPYAIITLMALTSKGQEVVLGTSNYDLRAINDEKLREREKIIFYDENGREIEGHVIMQTQYIRDYDNYIEKISEQSKKLTVDNNGAIEDFSGDLIILYKPFLRIFFENTGADNSRPIFNVQNIRDIKNSTVEETEVMKKHLNKYKELFAEFPSLIWLVVWISCYN